MKILILYGTTEGQTRKISHYLADRLLNAGNTVEVLDASDAEETDLTPFDCVIVAASLHMGHYQAGVVDFANANHDKLSHLQAIFVSVSLAAAGDDPSDRQGLKDCVRRFIDQTGWQPARTIHVAGAFRFTRYDFLKSWAMRYIAFRRDQPVDPNEDLELTDWQALARLADEVAATGNH